MQALIFPAPGTWMMGDIQGLGAGFFISCRHSTLLLPYWPGYLPLSLPANRGARTGW